MRNRLGPIMINGRQLAELATNLANKEVILMAAIARRAVNVKRYGVSQGDQK